MATDDDPVRPDEPVADETVHDPVAGADAATPPEGTAELSPLDPDEARATAAEIREIAEQRSEEEDEDDDDRQERPPPERTDDHAITQPIAIPPPAADEGLSADDLRDAWDVLDLAERLDGLRCLPREDAEDFFIALPGADQCAVLLAMRPGEQRSWLDRKSVV